MIGFNWKRATALAANVSIAVSLLLNLGIELLDITLPYGIHGGVPALITSLAIFLAISLAQQPQPIDPDIEAAMDL